ncbi:hypothetical protein D3C83_98440 [compost metagenome]
MKIDSHLINTNNDFIKRIESMVNGKEYSEFNAEIYFVLFEITKKIKYLKVAKLIYLVLFKRTKKFQYKLKLEKLNQ